MTDKIKFNDRIESRNLIQNLVESYLHLNGWGRKFILVKGCVKSPTSSLIEVKDPMSAKKILGNVARLFSYVVLFPLPLFSLAIRAWQRDHRQITLNPYQGNPVLEQRYRNLVEENIHTPFFPTKTLADKVNYHLVSLASNFSNEIYMKINETLKDYEELAPEALLLFTQFLTTGKDVGGYYEKHLVTLKFLKSAEAAKLIPDADRAAQSSKISPT